jgi:hypothetical protein
MAAASDLEQYCSSFPDVVKQRKDLLGKDTIKTCIQCKKRDDEIKPCAKCGKVYICGKECEEIYRETHAMDCASKKPMHYSPTAIKEADAFWGNPILRKNLIMKVVQCFQENKCNPFGLYVTEKQPNNQFTCEWVATHDDRYETLLKMSNDPAAKHNADLNYQKPWAEIGILVIIVDAEAQYIQFKNIQRMASQFDEPLEFDEMRTTRDIPPPRRQPRRRRSQTKKQ